MFRLDADKKVHFCDGVTRRDFLHAGTIAFLVYHTAAAVHDTGCQMMQTGRLFQGGLESPNYGCVLRLEKGPKGDMPPNVLIPYTIGHLKLQHREHGGSQ